MVTRISRLVCLRCIFQLFTGQLKLSPRTAYLEVRKHIPSIEELTGHIASRPYFVSEEKRPRCPYCNSTKKFHARMETCRIEGGRATDGARRALVKSLATSEDQFVVLESRSARQAVFFEWLDTLGRTMELNSDTWLQQVARKYLERKEPKTDWGKVFAQIHSVRRSSRLEESWEIDGDRLYLSHPLFDEVLLVQYLISRSHKAGGRTFEGRLTILELLRRLRRTGYLDRLGLTHTSPGEALEKLVEHLGGEAETVRLYHIVDRRDLLDKVKLVYAAYA